MATEDGLKLRDKIEEILLNKAPHRPIEAENVQEIEEEDEVVEDEEEETEDEETQPFTVVRVSSSVSQVKTNCAC